jgi:hypothetical protein
MENDRDWKKISGTLFPADNGGSEAFVGNVMRRIERAESGPRIVRVPVQWLAPAMGVAAMLLLSLIPGKDIASTETLLTGGDASSVYGQSADIDDAFGFMEAR